MEGEHVPLFISLYMPPPAPAIFPVIMQFTNTGELSPPFDAPFEIAPPPAALLIENTELMISGELVPFSRPELYIAPPKFCAVLFINSHPTTTGEAVPSFDPLLYNAPPLKARFPENTMFRMVGVEEFPFPDPSLCHPPPKESPPSAFPPEMINPSNTVVSVTRVVRTT